MLRDLTAIEFKRLTGVELKKGHKGYQVSDKCWVSLSEDNQLQVYGDYTPEDEQHLIAYIPWVVNVVRKEKLPESTLHYTEEELQEELKRARRQEWIIRFIVLMSVLAVVVVYFALVM